MNSETLPTYLNDHLALMTGEIELLQRVCDENSGSSLAEELQSFCSSVQQQADVLDGWLKSLDAEPATLKQAAAWLGEKLGRLKLNDGGLEYTDLARLVELEALIGCAMSRQIMWDALAKVPSGELRIPAQDLSKFAAEARDQQEILHRHHSHAATQVFSSDSK